jgi:hypothetical protein
LYNGPGRFAFFSRLIFYLERMNQEGEKANGQLGMTIQELDSTSLSEKSPMKNTFYPDIKPILNQT